MANAMLFYRTPATDIVTIPDPNNLPIIQKLLFTPPDDLASGINELWTNNIVRKVPPVPGGRKLIQTDEGFSGWTITISGNYLIATAESALKLFEFRKLVQQDVVHTFGVFGILYPNGPSYFNIDPDTTKGLMIQSTTGKHIGITTQLFDFSVTLSLGGTA